MKSKLYYSQSDSHHRKVSLRGRLLSPSLVLILLGILGFFPQLRAQVQITCPPNLVVSTDSLTCDAQVMYAACVTNTINTTNTVYAFTGSTQIFVVPANVCEVTIEALGAQGQSNPSNIVGGLGGSATGTLAVTPGETLYVEVGGGGSISTTGGYNGGGNAGSVGCATAFGGGGGGASDVRQGDSTLAGRMIVAGGGAGAGGQRVQGCGRGTGGGGGGGYYGGGGGAAWPFTSTVLPTGGTQIAGGTGGTSDWTSVTNNDGTAGVLGIGGTGGDEASSSQGGNADALSGGAGGGSTGGSGAYSANWTGQSGAGGSGYIGGVTGGSMLSGVRSGNGQITLTYNSGFSVNQIAGTASGGVFPLGTTTNSFVVTDSAFTDSCTFTISVVDSTVPQVLDCPATDTLFADASCDGILPDYSATLNIFDNCDANPTVVQTPMAGAVVSGLGGTAPVTLAVTDSSGNVSNCNFNVVVVDSTAPVASMCPPSQIFTPTVLDCNPAVNFAPPVFADNCTPSPAITSTSVPGDNFPIGTTSITYTATDSSGNSGVCTFALTVTSPVLDGVVMQMPGAVCDGDTFSLGAPPGFASYAWSTGGTTPMITANMPGIYWVDVTDSIGCTGRDSFLVVANQPMPTVTPTGAALCAQPNFASYQWFQNGAAVPGATMPCFTPTTDGNFSVVVLDSIGCEGTSDTVFFVGVREALNHPGFEIFPNPAHNQLNVRMVQPLNEAGTVMLYDLAGRIVMRHEFEQLSGTVTLDLGDVSAGSYIVEIKGDSFLGRRRLLRME
ncbi:MAG: HYR domain-containing protein [Bacteroidota bacterium]